MTGNRLHAITAAMVISILVAALESTVIATAMPTIVADLGGLSIYAWVFSIYMLTSTTMIPIFGKLSDIYGRRPVYLAAMFIFLAGSALCALAQSMAQLVIFRAVQGIGAGGIMPLVFTIIGDIFSLEQRAKMQGVFSSIWALASIGGPVVGGVIVDNLPWPWVFWVNLPVGLLAAVIMALAWRDVSPAARGRVDYAGTLLLSGAIMALLLGLFQLNEGGGPGSPWFGALLALAVALTGALLWVERRAENPILPLPLFRERMFAVAMSHGFLVGFSIWGSWVFIPLFAQTVLGTRATAAGLTLMPMEVAWVIASNVSTRLLLRLGFRSIAISGMAATVAGMAGMSLVGPETPYWLVMTLSGLMGVGMGSSVPVFMIGVQTTVPRAAMGTATSSLQFSRNIGGTIGTSLMGVFMATRLAQGLLAGGLSPDSVSLGQLIDPLAGEEMAATLALLREALSAGVRDVFLAAGIAAALAWAVTLLAPRGRLAEVARAKPAEPQPAGD